MGRADAAVHVENDHLRWTAVMDLVDPRPVHVGQSFNVHIARQKLRLEAPHLAGGRSVSLDGLATDNPPHGRITSETLGVIHVIITANTSENRLAELTGHTVPSVLTGTAVLKNSLGNLAQAKCIVKVPIDEKPTIRGEPGTMEFQLQAAVKIDL